MKKKDVWEFLIWKTTKESYDMLPDFTTLYGYFMEKAKETGNVEYVEYVKDVIELIYDNYTKAHARIILSFLLTLLEPEKFDYLKKPIKMLLSFEVLHNVNQSLKGNLHNRDLINMLEEEVNYE